jgi:two-component system phosphate regulon sensor histidine kinase PhoR
MLIICLLLLLIAAAVMAWLARQQAKAAARQHADELATIRADHAVAVRNQEGRLQSLLDSMIEGIMVLDSQGHVALANHAAAKLFGFSEPATGRALIETVRHHEVVELVARLAKESAVLGSELRLEETPPRFLQINAVLLRAPAHEASGALLVFHDLTRVRELEGVRQEFVANVSHELRTPLSLIKGATETLLDGAKNDSVALDRLLTIVDRHADRLTLLIDDLLLLSKLDSGRVSLNLQPVPLRPAASEVVDDLQPRARAREMVIENSLPTGMLAHVDPDRLRQVLFNLIDNAIKYGRPAGTVTISGRMLDEKWVEICIQDNGPGISPEARARVFERFYRAEKARSREQGGTGLGLAIVKHVIQAHGGEVRVESELGQGAAFYFTLPR